MCVCVCVCIFLPHGPLWGGGFGLGIFLLPGQSGSGEIVPLEAFVWENRVLRAHFKVSGFPFPAANTSPKEFSCRLPPEKWVGLLVLRLTEAIRGERLGISNFQASPHRIIPHPCLRSPEHRLHQPASAPNQLWVSESAGLASVSDGISEVVDFQAVPAFTLSWEHK